MNNKAEKATVSINLLGMIAFLIYLSGCYPSRPRVVFQKCPAPTSPDYSKLDFWAAHPLKKDSADVTPSAEMKDLQESAKADVFFLHPTTYTGKWGQNKWNAPVDDAELNESTDENTIKNQATIFNACYKIYAPRYRQAHYTSYTNEKLSLEAKQAFELAYSDVKRAFEYYLTNHNNGRPILIAGHSQGTTHGQRLMKEFFDGTPLQKQLVAAYLPGLPVHSKQYNEIPPCDSSSQIGCINSWRTMKTGHYPKYHNEIDNDDVICVNPLSWTRDTSSVKADLHKGMVLLDFYEGTTQSENGARLSQNVLWIDKPHFRGSFLYVTPDFHQGDFNLFYMNIRQNACDRLEAFLKP